jgi:hypothetical protein
MHTLKLAAVIVVTSAVSSVCAASYVEWNGPRATHQLAGRCEPGDRWCLGTVSFIEQLTGSEGGPQALEGYTRVSTRASVRLAHGTIGNIEQAGSGDLIEARSLQAGGVVAGSGRVGRWVGVFIDRPKQKGSGAPIPREQMPDFRAIQFDNGLYLTTDVINGKPALLLCPNIATEAPCLVFKP